MTTSFRSAATLAAALLLATLATAKPPAVPKAIAAAVADTARPQADRDRDADRKPGETIAFAGLKRGQRIADLLPGGGYFTRIFSGVVGPKGQVIAVATPKRPDAPPDRPEPSAAVRAIAADEHYKNVTVVVEKLAELKLPEKLDMVWTSNNYHDVHNVKDIDLGAFNKAIFDSLVPGRNLYRQRSFRREGLGLRRNVDPASRGCGRRQGRGSGGRFRVRGFKRRHCGRDRRPYREGVRARHARQDGPLRPQIPQTEEMTDGWRRAMRATPPSLHGRSRAPRDRRAARPAPALNALRVQATHRDSAAAG